MNRRKTAAPKEKILGTKEVWDGLLVAGDWKFVWVELDVL